MEKGAQDVKEGVAQEEATTARGKKEGSEADGPGEKTDAAPKPSFKRPRKKRSERREDVVSQDPESIMAEDPSTFVSSSSFFPVLVALLLLLFL